MKKKFLKSAAIIGLSLSTLLGSLTLATHQKYKQYSDVDQIYAIAEELGADTTSITSNSTKQPIRMEHNGGEPIYVSVSDDFSEKEREYIDWSLDYVFDAAESINPNYTYKVVDDIELEYQKLLGKTTISYEVGEGLKMIEGSDKKSQGWILRNKSTLGSAFNKNLYKEHKIVYDREQHQESTENDKKYTFLHELLHAFGFDDVYVHLGHEDHIDRYCANTIMMSDDKAASLNCLTVNDYKNFIALLAPKMTDEKLGEFIEKQKQNVERYGQEFYKFYVALCETKTEMDSSLDDNKNYFLTATRTQVLEDGSQRKETHNVQIKDGKYKFAITDAEGYVVDQAEGDVVFVDGAYVLKDVELKDNWRPITDDFHYAGGYINDFVVMGDENQQYLYNYNENDQVKLNDASLQASTSR